MPPMHVLIIEDDREAAGYMAKGLKESGHNVDVVHDGQRGPAAGGRRRVTTR